MRVLIFVVITVCLLAIIKPNEKAKYLYFVYSEDARVYAEPDSYSEIIAPISYGTEVTIIESTNMWDKITCINTDGKEITGWIAKIDLVRYKDHELDTDCMYKTKK